MRSLEWLADRRRSRADDRVRQVKSSSAEAPSADSAASSEVFDDSVEIPSIPPIA